MYKVKTRGTGVFANAHVLTLYLHQHLTSSWLMVINIFLPREQPFNVNNQRLVQ